MKRIFVFCAFCALFGCKQANVPETEPIALYYSTAEASKTEVLSQGDEIGVFSNIEGTEKYFAENTKYIVGSDGRSLSTSPALYYPEAKQAVVFTAYLPFGGTWSGALGTFSVPVDQTTTLKQADLCWAKASSTPVATPVALEFQHKMARLLITTNTPTEKIAAPNAFSGGTLDIKTGTFTNTQKSEVFTTGNEFIVPAQTVTRLVLTLSGVDYTFDGSIVLETAKTTSINLTLNATTHTATLAGSSTTNWISSSGQGNTAHAVSNAFTIHWLPIHSKAEQVNTIKLLLYDEQQKTTTETTIPATHQSDGSYTSAFSHPQLSYPYKILNVLYYKDTELIGGSPVSAGATIYKSGATTIGCARVVSPPTASEYVYDTPSKLYWAHGPLIANDNGGCSVAYAVGNMGLFFRVGSLLAWSGGTTGDGQGVSDWPSKLEIVRRPSGCTYTNTAWDATIYTDLDHGYLGIADPNSTLYGKNFKDYPGFSEGAYWHKGVGDPCTYYLGEKWRMPTGYEVGQLMYIAWPNTNPVTSSYNGWVPIKNPTVWGMYQSTTKMYFHGMWYVSASGKYAYDIAYGREGQKLIGWTGGFDDVIGPSIFESQASAMAEIGGSGWGFWFKPGHNRAAFAARCVSEAP